MRSLKVFPSSSNELNLTWFLLNLLRLESTFQNQLPSKKICKKYWETKNCSEWFLTEGKSSFQSQSFRNSFIKTFYFILNNCLRKIFWIVFHTSTSRIGLRNVSPSRHIISEETNLNFCLKLFDKKRKRERERERDATAWFFRTWSNNHELKLKSSQPKWNWIEWNWVARSKTFFSVFYRVPSPQPCSVLLQKNIMKDFRL